MNFWLCIASDYHTLSIALCQQDRAIDIFSIDKTQSNRSLAPFIKQLLDTHALTFSNISFIGVNAGPGPYTSLRIAIATANGLAFATGIKLVSIDALQALLEEHKHTDYKTTVALLNAFNQEVFYGITTENGFAISGYTSIDRIESIIQQHANGPYYLIGNGVELFKEQLQQIPDASINTQITYASLPAMVKYGYKSWQEQNLHDELFPLYLKEVHYTNSIKIK